MNQRISLRGVLGTILLAAFATGCTTVKVVDEYTGRPLPRPNLLLVYDFAVSPDQVRLDRGVSPMLEDAIKGTPRTQQEIQIGGQVANALTARKPDMAETMGVGGLTGNLVAAAAISAGGAVGSEAFGANVDADAARLAKKLAEEFQSFAERQGWTPES